MLFVLAEPNSVGQLRAEECQGTHAQSCTVYCDFSDVCRVSSCMRFMPGDMDCKEYKGLLMECTFNEFFRRDSRRIFVVSIILNYPWERVQSSLYLTKEGTAIPWWHCMLASWGDGFLVLLMFWAGRVVFDNPAWFHRPGLRGYLFMAVTGMVLIIPLEWLMISSMEWWSYTAQMPLMPGIAVGVSPVAQMLLLPPLIFRMAAIRRKKSCPDQRQFV